MANTTLKVLTKCVDIENERFVLVEITRNDDGHKFIGTIPYSELDEKGCMKRQLNGFEMRLSDSIPNALQGRIDEIKTRGMKPEQLLNYFINRAEA